MGSFKNIRRIETFIHKKHQTLHVEQENLTIHMI